MPMDKLSITYDELLRGVFSQQWAKFPWAEKYVLTELTKHHEYAEGPQLKP